MQSGELIYSLVCFHSCYIYSCTFANYSNSKIKSCQKLYGGEQCWGKLLLKVMHYNIALLHKKVIVLLLMESNALHYFCITFYSVIWAGLAYLFLITKNPKVIFLVTVNALSNQNELALLIWKSNLITLLTLLLMHYPQLWWWRSSSWWFLLLVIVSGLIMINKTFKTFQNQTFVGHRLFSAIIKKPIEKSYWVKGTRVMQTSLLAYKNITTALDIHAFWS